MIVYAIRSDGSCAEIARLDSLETVTVSPEPEETPPEDDLRKLCPDIDFTVNGETDPKDMLRAFGLDDALIDALVPVARIMALRAAISVEEALSAVARLIATTQEGKELCELYEEAIDYEDNISELRAESMEPHPVIVIFPALETLRHRTLRDLYGQGVDTGPLDRPSGADPPR